MEFEKKVAELVTEQLLFNYCELLQAGNWGRGPFGKPEEGERPLLKAATKQRLGKIEKTLCVL
jgi:hypothetical protein